MNRQEVLDLVTPMALAWPYPEWDDARLELWVQALADLDFTDAARVVVANAVRTREKAPEVAWIRKAIRAELTKDDMGGPPALESPPASKESALAAIREARAAMQGRN